MTVDRSGGRLSGPSMHLWPEPEARSGPGVLRACRVERKDGAPKTGAVTLWYSLPDLGLGQRPEPDEPFLIAATIQAMAEGRDLVLHGTASAELLGNLAEFCEAWHRWRPQTFARVDIGAEQTTPRGVARRRETGVAVSYSGGVDSSWTIWRHVSGLAGQRSRGITHAVFVHGFDIPLADTAAFEAGCGRAAPLLAALGISLVPVRTNFRDALPFYWEMAYGVALASCFHQLRPHCGEALFASSRPYDVLTFPMGSNVVTDGLLSSAELQVVHDGAGRNRCEKVAGLAGWPAGLAALRVCWEGTRRDRNCGFCEKCVRTMHNFLVAGLPIPPSFERAPTLSQVEGVRLRSRSLAEEWSQLVIAAERNGVRAPWVRVARRKVARHRTRVAVREAASQLARATLPTSVRHFIRRTVFA
ncbi:MAG TPA: hypothetical protein VIE46_08165 [Gemmatimonadales bacterium]